MSWLVLLLAGALQAASLAWPVAMPQALAWAGWVQGEPLWWGQGLALATLAGSLRSAACWRLAALRGWIFATSWLACTFGWLFTSMHTYGGLATPLAVLAVLALAGLLALYYAAACGVFRHLTLKHPVWAALAFAAPWLLAEMARGMLLTGFGWGAIGYAHLVGPLAGLIPWAGLYGVSFVAAWLAAVLALGLLAVLAGRWRNALDAGAVLLLLMLMPPMLPQPQGGSAGTLDVTLLQGNIPQNEKFDSQTGVLKALQWYGAQLRQSTSPLVITPETALPLLPGQLPPGYWQALQQRFAKGDQAALVGVPLGSYAEGYTNSVVGFKPAQSSPWRYDKHHLVPFGEFIPPLFRWFTDLMAIPLGDFTRGALPQPTFDWQGQRLAATICYENLFSEELARQFLMDAKAPTMLVNVSNLGWFGDRLAMDQHLQIARLRTLEFDRPFLLATNTGRTAIVDHRGRVTHAATPHTAVALNGTVEGRTGITPYAWWLARWGQWPMAVLALLVLAWAWTVRKR
ncbi:apolipoprotein N-acyltransferase [Rhodoferax sp.]|uniref:apolipoprotein N-acyltransferase n=1 Tax=Rhodoferax sp. TaxID=50421 RepID=UPI002606284A|nr:apolipoprotein N-acyltransferase [Rhodoferax sp.]MDD2919705.1 apolipoprotein N-acyltransferase [Rhodoferax sp.]